MTITRRQILSTGAAGVGLAVAGTIPALGGVAGASAPAHVPANGGGRSSDRLFPALVDDPNGILALPAGFAYTVASRVGVTDLAFGQGKTPDYHDGTAVVGRTWRGYTLIQNHEMTPNMSTFGVPHVAGTVYDPGAVNASGCTVLTTDGRGGRVAEWVGISGTVRNCAGGPTPWGTWLTCEETYITAGATWSAGGATGTYEKNHGYVFEVFPDTSDRQLPNPIKAFGRFEHEAIAVEPGRNTGLPHRGCQRPERPRLPLDGTSRRAARRRHRQAPRRHRRDARGDADPARRRQHPPRRGLHHLRAARSSVQGDVESRFPIGRRPPRRSAASSPTAPSPGARSSRACGPTTGASTSSTASPSARATCRPTRPSTTGWCGSTTSPTRPSRSSPTSRTTRSPRAKVRSRRTPT